MSEQITISEEKYKALEYHLAEAAKILHSLKEVPTPPGKMKAKKPTMRETVDKYHKKLSKPRNPKK